MTSDIIECLRENVRENALELDVFQNKLRVKSENENEILHHRSPINALMIIVLY